jgi:hypothetical protein
MVPHYRSEEKSMPEWMEPLIEAIAANMSAHGPNSPLGLRYRQLDDVWDMLVYATPVEMIGGAHDGGRACPSFSFDVEGLRSAIGQVDSVTWEPHGARTVDDDVGPCIVIRGRFGSHAILLRVLAHAPLDVEPAVKVDATGKSPTA